MTYSYYAIVKKLKENGIESAAFEARELISWFCGVSHAYVLSHSEQEYESSGLCDAVERRCARVPLQYIFGECGFRNCTFKVTEDTLVPRADTEMLVEYAVNNLCEGAKILDLCTGSGCIAISILAERKDICAVATDISDATLAVARENALKNDVSDRIVFMREDALCPKEVISCAPFDAVISNPPYIPTEHINGLSPEVKKEPYRALDGGDDGLVFYRNITEKYGSLLSDEGFILYEIGYDQEDAIKSIAKKFGFDCIVTKDVEENPRMAYLYKAGENKNETNK